MSDIRVINDFEDQESLDIDISGSGVVDLHHFEGARTLNIEITGSSSVNANDEIESLQFQYVDITGSGVYNAVNVSSIDAEIDISGSGECWVTVSEDLEVDITGPGDVYHNGATNVSFDITGSGDIIVIN